MTTQYLLLIRGGESDQAYSQEELRAALSKFRAWTNQLRDAGVYIDAGKLTNRRHVLRRRQDQIQVDGPFSETKETIGGFFIVTADDYAAAFKIAEGCPIFAEGGHIEIREIEQ